MPMINIPRFCKIFLYILLTLYGIITLIPFVWALSASFKSLSEIASGSLNLVPHNFTLDNYKQIFLQEPLFSRWLFNSVVIVISVTALNSTLWLRDLGGFPVYCLASGKTCLSSTGSLRIYGELE